MDPKIRAEFDAMREAHRRAMERIEKAEKRMDRHERKMAALDAAWRERMDKADQRADRLDQQLQVTAKLVREGIKFVRGLAADTRELKRSQKAFLDSLRIGGNGRGHAG